MIASGDVRAMLVPAIGRLVGFTVALEPTGKLLGAFSDRRHGDLPRKIPLPIQPDYAACHRRELMAVTSWRFWPVRQRHRLHAVSSAGCDGYVVGLRRDVAAQEPVALDQVSGFGCAAPSSARPPRLSTSPRGRTSATIRVIRGMLADMGRQVAVVLFVMAMVAVIVGVDFQFFRNQFWERLIVNIGIVLVFGAFYFRFLRRP
jgi:hypothetical protein